MILCGMYFLIYVLTSSAVELKRRWTYGIVEQLHPIVSMDVITYLYYELYVE